MITVYCIRPADGGFGEFQKQGDCVRYPELETLDDYTGLMQREASEVTLLGEEDEDFAQVEDADGHIYGQNDGTVIGWKDPQGYVSLELVYEG